MKYRHLDRVAKLIMDFNVHVMRAVDRERPDTSCELLCHQLVRVMLAAGASYRWGRRASNKREFVNRLRVSHAEFVECIFWLERVRVLRPNPVWEQELSVAKQIDNILVASLKKARGK